MLSSCERWGSSVLYCHFWGKQPNALTLFMYAGSRPNGFTAGLLNYYLDHRMCFFYGLKTHLFKCSCLSSTKIINFCPKPPLSSSHFSGLHDALHKAKKSQASRCLHQGVFNSACESSPNPWWGQHSCEQLHATDLCRARAQLNCIAEMKGILGLA